MTVTALPARPRFAPGGQHATLPPEPLVQAVDAAAQAQATTPGVLLGANSAELRAYHRARNGHRLKLSTVDTICGLLRCHLSELYGRRADGTSAPSTWTLVRRPEPPTVPCGTCTRPMSALTVDGCLASRPSAYCTPACRATAAKLAYARKLDRLRAVAGVPRTGARQLSNRELDQLLKRFQGLLRPAA